MEKETRLRKGQLASLEETIILIEKTGFSLETAEQVAKRSVQSFIAQSISTLPLEDLLDLLSWINSHE